MLFADIVSFNLRTGQTLPLTLLQVLFAFSFSISTGAVTWKESWLIPLIAHVLMNATAGEGSVWLSLIVSGVMLTDEAMLLGAMIIEKKSSR